MAIMEIVSINQCYRIADAMDGCDAQRAINFAGYTAEQHRRHIKTLAWACMEKNARKRADILSRVIMEIEAGDGSTADLPDRSYLAPNNHGRFVGAF